jgi:predicted DCC family thiol-disulfide oxidoreductase YuxK
MDSVGALTVLYDERCAVCRRARDWLLTEPTHLPVELLAAGSPAARARFGLVPWRGAELVVIADTGEVWAGPAAFLTAMWATVRWRSWSYRLSGRHLAPLAERFFRLISHHRKRVNALLSEPECTWCESPTHVGTHRLGDAEPVHE